MSRGATRDALRTIRGGVRQLLAVRWVRWLAVLLLLAVGVRLALGTLLSVVVSRLAAERELTVAWDDLDLSITGGNGTVHWLVVASRGPDGKPGDALAEIEYATFDLNLMQLLRGRLSVTRAEIDGADLHLARDAEGRWNFEQHVAAAEVLSLLEKADAPEEPAPEPAEEPAEPRPIQLVPPVAIEALRLQHARVHVVDRALAPERRLDIEAGAWLTSLRTSDRPTRFGVELFGAGLLDTARLDGEARWSEQGLAIDLRAQAGAQGLSALDDYLEPLHLRPVAEALEAAFQAHVELAVVGEARDALAAHVTVQDAHVLADGHDAFALGRLALSVGSLSARGARVDALALEGARGGIELRPDGALRLAGFDLLAPPREAQPPLTWEQIVASVLDLTVPGALPPWIALLGARDPAAWPWSLGELSARDCAFDVTDAGVDPPARFALELEQATLSGVAHDPALAPQPIPFEARLSAPGLARTIHVSGTVLPWAPDRSLDVEVALEGIAPAAADVYLEGAGLERSLSNGHLTLALSAEAHEEAGVTRAQLSTREIALEDSGELFGVRELALRDVVLDPAAHKLRLGELVVSGPRLAFVRDPAESFLALGLRVTGRTKAAPAGEDEAAVKRPVAPPPIAATPPTEPVTLEIGRIAWLDSSVRFTDESTDPPTSFAIDELGLELEGLVLGGDPEGPAPPPARVSGHLRAPGLAEQLTLEGSVESRPGTLDLAASVDVRGEGLRGNLLVPYLRPLGITPTMEQGELLLKAGVALRGIAAGWSADLRIAQTELSEGDQTLLAVEELGVEGLAVGADGLRVDALTVRNPIVHVARDPDGGLQLGGVRVAQQPGEDGADAAPAPAAAPAPLALPALPDVRVGSVDVEGARLVWADRTFEPPLEVELDLGAHLGELSTRGAPAAFALDLAVPGALSSLAVKGTLSLAPERVALDARVEGELQGSGPLTPLLPPGITFGDEPAALSGAASLELRPADGGGLSARVEAKDLRWSTASTPGFACALARAVVTRVDPLARVVELGELTVDGVELDARRDAAGALHALGLTLAAPPAEPAAAPAPKAARTRRLPAREGAAPARIAFGPVHLAATRLALRDETLGADAQPLVASVALSIDPATVLDAEPAALPPIAWRVEGAIDGLVERWQVDGTLAPFADEPSLAAMLTASGVRTKDVTRFLPGLAGRLSGDLEQGEVAGRLEAALSVRRAFPADLALDRPFGGELHLSDLALRDAPGGAVLLGLDGLDVEIQRIDPASGDVHLDALELRTPRARIERDGTRLSAAGLTFDTAVASDAPVEASAPAAEPARPLAVSGEDADAAPDLRVDRVSLSGIDVELSDRTAEPALLVPLDRLELETGRVSTRDLARGGAVSFSGELGARATKGSAPVFDAVSLAGRVAAVPAPKGWVQLDLSGLELAPFSGLAGAKGLALDDGALDLSTRLRLKGERGATAGVTAVFSDLDVSEPDGGFLQSVLSLPVTLDTALFLLRNADGEQRLSVDVSVGPDGIGAGAIAAAAASATVQVIAGAVAGAPLRLLGSVVPGGGSDEPRPRDVTSFAFAPGTSELSPNELARLDALAWRIRARPSLRVVVRQELGQADLARAAVLANPSREACLELTAGLRQRKSELWRRRDALAAQSRALYAVGAREATGSGEELRAVEAKLAQVEDALDRVLDVLRSDSERQKAKRTRAAAREIADLRLEAVAHVLREALAESRPERIEVRPAGSAKAVESGGGRVLIELIAR